MDRSQNTIDQYKQKQKAFFNNYRHDHLVHATNIPYAQNLVKKMLASLTGKRTTILEVGAGQGRFTLELAHYVDKLTAIDFSEYEIAQLVKHAKEAHINNIRASVHDLLTLEKTLKRQQYDHVVGFFVLHHLHRQSMPRVVHQLARFLKKGGRLAFIEPNKFCPSIFCENILLMGMKWELEKMIYSDYLERFQRACIQEGLTVRVNEKVGFFPPVFINRWPALLTVESLIERIPLLSEVLCPFILVSFDKG